MIDTITLFTDSTYDPFESQNINIFNNSFDDITGEILPTGKYFNFRVSKKANGVLISGSLHKYIDGNNLSNMSYSKMAEGLKKLCNELSLNMNETKLYRFDLAYNFTMNKPIINYFNQFTTLSRYQKTTYNNSLTVQYKNSYKTLVFYNKIKEMLANGIKLDKEQLNLIDNILRYEIRFRRNLPKQFNVETVMLDKLLDKDFISTAINKWKDNYFNIIKSSKPLIDNNIFDSKLSLMDFLASDGLNNIGVDNLMTLLSNNRSNISRQDYSRHRKTLKHLSQLKSTTNNNSLISELDNKINLATQYLLDFD